MTKTKEEIRKTTLENILNGFAPVNQESVRRELARREAKGRQLTTNIVWAISWQRVQRQYPGRRFADLSADDWLAFVIALRERLAATTVYTTVGSLKAGLARMNGVKEVPADILDALEVEVPEVEKPGHVLDDADFYRLLELASEEGRRYQTPAHIAMKQAILWTFRDTGFRSDELRSLNIGEIQFQGPDDGGAYIQLPTRPEALNRDCRLKTKKSSRRIYVHECAAPIKAWLALHPDGTNPHAPLFLGWRISQGQRLTKLILGNWIRTLGIKADLEQKWGTPDTLGAHDFRHTRITQAVRDNWHPVKGSMYFWGIPNSKEWATYAHTTAADLRDQVRRDLGLDELGYKVPVQAAVGVTQAMIDDAVRRVLGEQMAPKGVQRPGFHQLP